MTTKPSILGAVPRPGGRTEFTVWAPDAERIEVRIVEPRERLVPLGRLDSGYHTGVVDGVTNGATYLYRIDGHEDRPDPASRHQPSGVHGPSGVVDLSYPWGDREWRGLPFESYAIYELHVGTFTPEGTFDAVVPRLDALRDLGITAIEIMPVSQFPGEHNWGYDGVYPFAVQHSYGGPSGLQRLVDACHARGLAVVLDVVYNHLGPEGNYLGRFGPYFTDRYRTPWGPALNFDGPDSDEVRRYFIDNALQWVRDYHIDALRLDAIHGIYDFSAVPFLADLQLHVADFARDEGRHVHLVSESDLNDSRVVRPLAEGGHGHAAQWCDDLHHALHVLLTGERQGYYMDFGSLDQMARSLREAYVYSGQYSPFRRRSHGNSTAGLDGSKFVVFAQNHDQVGNRMLGDRLSAVVDHESLKLAAGVVILSPSVPLLFMGEEYGEDAPFQYFVSHSDPDLVTAVRRGRAEEFASFSWKGEPPDPQSEATFLRSKLRWESRSEGSHATLLRYHAELLRLRRALPALRQFAREGLEVLEHEAARVVSLRRWVDGSEVVALFAFAETALEVDLALPPGRWSKRLDSSASRWGGPDGSLPERIDSTGGARLALPTRACILYVRE